MAEDQFQPSSRQPRFRSSRYPTGVSGGLTAQGNLAPPSNLSVSGAAPASPPQEPTPEAPPIQQIQAQEQKPSEALANADPVAGFLVNHDPVGKAILNHDPVGGAIVKGVSGVVNKVGSFLGVGGGGGGCFLTEAVMAATGQGDDAPELEVLRMYRDQVLMRSPAGQQLVAAYEEMAPGIVDAINMSPNAAELYSQLYQQYIAPCVQAIQSGDHQQALQLYSQMVAAAHKMADEVEMAIGYGDETPDTEGSDMPDPTAVAYDGVFSGEATQGGMPGEGPSPYDPGPNQGFPRVQQPMGAAAIAMGGMEQIPPPANQDVPTEPNPEDLQDPNYQDAAESTPDPARRNAIEDIY